MPLRVAITVPRYHRLFYPVSHLLVLSFFTSNPSRRAVLRERLSEWRSSLKITSRDALRRFPHRVSLLDMQPPFYVPFHQVPCIFWKHPIAIVRDRSLLLRAAQQMFSVIRP